jgi:hypothetical protein
MVSIATIPVVNRYSFDAENHIHALDGKPLMGTSTVVGALGKPLTYWAAGCALTPLGWLNRKKSTVNERLDMAGQKLAMLRDLDREQYVAFLEKCYHAHTKTLKDTAAEGTDTHAQLANYVQTCIDEFDGVAQPLLPLSDDKPSAVEIFAWWADKNVRQFLWSEKHCYSEELWVGGISDCGCKLTNGDKAVIDFKRKGCYYSQHVQIGGYAAQIAENGLFDSDGEQSMDRWFPDKVIVFPNAGKPRTQDARKYAVLFAGVVEQYKAQQEYDNAY